MKRTIKSKSRLSQIRGRREKNALPKTRLVVAYHDLPERTELPPRIQTNPKIIHYCPNPYKIHNKVRIPMHKAGWVWSGTVQTQKFRCPRCGFATTFTSDNLSRPN